MIMKTFNRGERRGTQRNALSAFSLLVILIALILTGCKQKNNQVHSHDKYTCPMHPQIVSDKPGTCPICKMDLVKVEAATGEASLHLMSDQIKLANIKIEEIKMEEIGYENIVTGK